MFNIVAVQGYMVKDVIMRTTINGQKIAAGTIAVDADYKQSSDGTRPVDFLDFKAWNMVAENLRKYFPKGKQAILFGRMEMEQYEDSNGRKCRKTVISVQKCYFCGKKSDLKSGNEDIPSFEPPEYGYQPMTLSDSEEAE